MGEQRTVGKVKVVRVEGEWQVRVWDASGRRWEAADYFASDRADAEGTARLMQPDAKTASARSA